MRTKKVFPTGEIAHLWAHQRQDEARNPGGNFYFNGKVIYSYGSHFPIAKLFDGLVLMTTRGYSSTTAKHVHDVRAAINHLRDITLHVPHVDVSRNGSPQFSGSDHEKNIKWIIDEYKANKAITEKDKRTKEETKARAQAAIEGLRDTAKRYMEYFHISQVTDTMLNEELIRFISGKAQMSAKQIQKVVDKQNEDIRKHNEAKLAEWRAGEYRSLNSTLHSYLRLKDDEVQTSQSLAIPVKFFKALYGAWKKKPAKIIGKEVLGYEVKVATETVVIIGCHNLAATEIEYIAGLLGLNK